MRTKIKNLIGTTFGTIRWGHEDVKTNSKSGVIKIVQDVGRRRETGSILALNESKPRSNTSISTNTLFTRTLMKSIMLGVRGGVKTIIKTLHMDTLAGRWKYTKMIIPHLQNVNIKPKTQNYNVSRHLISQAIYGHT